MSCALAAAIATTVTAQPSPTPSPSISPSPAPSALPTAKPDDIIPAKPTGGQLKIGSEEGFGIGGLDPDPTALYGPNRVPPVLPDNGNLSTLNLSGYYANKPAPNQRILFELEGDNTQFGFDLSYSIHPKDWSGLLTANLFLTDGRIQSFESGPVSVGLLNPLGDSPWFHQKGGGLEYSQQFTPELQLAAALNYRETTVHDGPFSNRVLPYDQLGNPLTLTASGIDDMLAFRVTGLFSTLDDKQFPTSGTKLRFGVEQTIPVGATQMNSTRLLANFTQFIPVHLFGFGEGPRTIIFNLQGGTMLGDAPGYDAFNMGGVNSVRGWDQGELATGQSFLETSAEYRFPIARPTWFGHDLQLRGTFFADYGTDLGTAGDVLGRPGLVRGKLGEGGGIGGGLHLISPIGLIRLESAISNIGVFQVYLTIGDRY